MTIGQFIDATVRESARLSLRLTDIELEWDHLRDRIRTVAFTWRGHDRDHCYRYAASAAQIKQPEFPEHMCGVASFFFSGLQPA